MTKTILVLGSVNADHVLKVSSFPRPGETITGSGYEIIPGGKGANQAVACARLGGKTRFKACIGQDAFGNEIISKFAEDDIDTSLIDQIEDVNTGVALIFVDTHAENCIGISAEANGYLNAERVAKNSHHIADADYLLMQLETPEEAIYAAAKAGKAGNTEVVLNPAPARPLPDDILACVDMITPNQTEAEVLTGVPVQTPENAQKAAAVLHEKGIKTVVITMGKQGAMISVKQSGQVECQMVSSYRVEATDTTAAGDTFNGAMLVALSEGKNLLDAVQFGNASAAISVTRSGAQTSIPVREEVERFLASQS
ncbi:ribokinase [Endozoicomonas sp. (ex Bugula neritina AB1)]|nr:ribokinase [Endozoicomonas sp. (ex Bugula neritina AB1)]